MKGKNEIFSGYDKNSNDTGYVDPKMKKLEEENEAALGVKNCMICSRPLTSNMSRMQNLMAMKKCGHRAHMKCMKIHFARVIDDT